ncbi:fibrinogen-like protein 1 isoform X1 [Anguilla anguilla]|uniref:fibrinogen-like protein 1 isoform X1 n=2 Tax=Anguilla anguilla TaxID=7936 RepID=UPI0015A93EC2|nr:fibrinogen-like protein 1 isoform X1 [Anguilla anguilla]
MTRLPNTTRFKGVFIMGMTDILGLRLLIFGLVFIVDSSVSAPDECQQETARLRSQLRALESRALRQQELIEQLRSRQAEASLSVDRLVDLGELKDYADCAQIYNDGNKASGFYMIKPLHSPSKIKVYCDMSDGGGWTVFQRRSDGGERFDRDWADYKKGFGNMQSNSGEFWLGNDNLHYLTSQGDYELRVNMADFDDNQRYAVYRSFKVASEEDSYQLAFGKYSGSAGDSLAGGYHPEVQWWASHQGMKFSTHDRDNDRYERNCAREDKAGWWFNRCHSANLNGYYYKGPYSSVTDNGIVWYTWHGWWYSLKSVVMKIRPENFEPNEV